MVLSHTNQSAIVGSFNADMKSVYQDTELMLVADSKELCAQLKTNFESYQEDAVSASVKEEETDFLSQKKCLLSCTRTTTKSRSRT